MVDDVVKSAHFSLGIDFGTSGARACAIDWQGNVQAQTHLRWDSVSPEQLATTWQAALFDLICQLSQSVRQQLSRITIAGTSATGLLCDPIGHPLLPPLLYNDTRATAEATLLHTLAPTGHPVLSASSSLAKLLWCQSQPEFNQARYWLHQADWLGFLLHGQLGVSDYHNSLKLGYAPELVAYPAWLSPHSSHPPRSESQTAHGQERELENRGLLARIYALLPHVVAPGSIVGTILPDVAGKVDVPLNCKICAGTTDSIAAFIASGANQPGQAVTSLGSTLVLKLLSTTKVDVAEFGIYSHRYHSLWLVGGASNCGAAILRRYFSDSQLVELSQQIDPRQPSHLDYYPLLTSGERFPINDPNLPPRLEPRPADDVQFLHGLLESLARIEAQGYQHLAKLGCTPLTQVYSAGGGAQNPTWTAIRQRRLRVSVSQSPHTEAAYGAALLGWGKEEPSLQTNSMAMKEK
jgi:xylulokinase